MNGPRTMLRFRQGKPYRSDDPIAEEKRRQYTCACGERHNGAYGKRRCEDCYAIDQVRVDHWLRVMAA